MLRRPDCSLGGGVGPGAQIGFGLEEFEGLARPVFAGGELLEHPEGDHLAGGKIAPEAVDEASPLLAVCGGGGLNGVAAVGADEQGAFGIGVLRSGRNLVEVERGAAGCAQFAARFRAAGEFLAERAQGLEALGIGLKSFGHRAGG